MPEFALDSATRRRLRSGGYLAIIAVVIIAAMLASNVNDSAHAAEKPPTVTWTRTVTSVAGRDLCQYNATVTATPGLASKGMVQAAALFVAVDFERPSDGTVVLHSKAFVCSTSAAGTAPSPGPAGSPPPANDSATNLEPAGRSQPATGTEVKVTPVSFADVRNDAAESSESSRIGRWILGITLGVFVAAVVAIAAPAAIVAAGAAVGVTISAELASIAAACLAGATGGAIGEAIKGNTKVQIATSAIVGCAGGSYVAGFKSLQQARSVMGQAAANLAGDAAAATQSSAQTVVGSAVRVTELAPAANTVGEGTQPLSNTVRDAMHAAAAAS